MKTKSVNGLTGFCKAEVTRLNPKPTPCWWLLGNDLSRIANELNKLEIILPKGSTITPNQIEENIGFSKDFNVFEFRKAIGEGNKAKAHQIATYFAQNQKENPMVVVNGQVFSFFLPYYSIMV